MAQEKPDIVERLEFIAQNKAGTTRGITIKDTIEWEAAQTIKELREDVEMRIQQTAIAIQQRDEK